MRVQADPLAMQTLKVARTNNLSTEALLRKKGSFNIPTKRGAEHTLNISQPIDSNCPTLPVANTRPMTGFERIMAAAGADTETQLMSFINDYNDFEPMPSLMAGSSGGDTFELDSEAGTRKQKVSFNQTLRGYVSNKGSHSNYNQSLYIPKLNSTKPSLCFEKISPNRGSQNRESLLSKMLQNYNETPESRKVAPNRCTINSVRESIPLRLPLPCDTPYESSSKPFISLRGIRNAYVPQQRYQTYFDEVVQIW
ncbi:hypothetical protein K7432_005389 [Basidiobolus ranarum]|uniref:Uncharacterized protein n=1 Tax=Basidiobolus ranarum TaxID=34480 RepID=A0ABR2WWR7_9FUNG